MPQVEALVYQFYKYTKNFYGIRKIVESRFQSLDGWRGVSISLVVAGHWLPLGPKAWQMNHAVAATGMAIFFILSGFLITSLLLSNQGIKSFLIRRLARIVPLAWLALFILLALSNATTHQWLSNLFFYANWPPMGLISAGGHFWSLCLEVQFYFLIAIMVALLKQRAFLLLPIMCVAVTGYRFFNEVEMAINTYFRLDEILAGCVLALIFNSKKYWLKEWLGKLNTPLLLALLIFSAHRESEYLNYLRPYIALLLVASTLFSPPMQVWNRLLDMQPLIYIASISYAFYVIHGTIDNTWLGTGDTFEKYAKRPFLFVITWVLAHISTNYYEKYWIDLGKVLSMKFKKPSRHPL